MCLLWKPVTQFTAPEKISNRSTSRKKTVLKYHKWVFLETSFLGLLISQLFLSLKSSVMKKSKPWTRWSRQASQWCHPSCDSSDVSIIRWVRGLSTRKWLRKKKQQKMQESLNARCIFSTFEWECRTILREYESIFYAPKIPSFFS